MGANGSTGPEAIAAAEKNATVLTARASSRDPSKIPSIYRVSAALQYHAADPIVEEEIGAFFPQLPQHITQDHWLGFKNWLKSDMGWPIRGICKPWYEHVRHSHIVCYYCRGGDVINVDSGSEIGTEEEDDGDVESDAAGEDADGESDEAGA
ncbi:Augmin subunit [Thalictrum thalictroides]|uniref:Augmin subunit n=1 Tax=Thalictrum thalictroides TaxID=46969 RepID=A0A7J6UV43_THATH|nr:Augmin subunit [Thalictrum thalictroides]